MGSTKGRLSISLFWQWLRGYLSLEVLWELGVVPSVQNYEAILCVTILVTCFRIEELRFHQETKPIQRHNNLFEMSDAWRRICHSRWVIRGDVYELQNTIRFWIFQTRWLKPLPYANMIVTKRPWVFDLKSVS